MRDNRYRVCAACAARRGVVREEGTDWIGDAFTPHRQPATQAEEVTTFQSRARRCDDCGAFVAHFWLLAEPAPHRGGPRGVKADRESIMLRLTPENTVWLRVTAAQQGCSMADVANRLLDTARGVS